MDIVHEMNNTQEKRLVHIDDFPQGSRKIVKLDSERNIVVIHDPKNYGVFHALDALCFHHGGPLCKGDIEEIFERLVIVCPWHKYKIDLETGTHIDTDLQKKPRCTEKAQRVHETAVDSSGYVWIKPTMPTYGISETYRRSDTYNGVRLNQKQEVKIAGRKNDGPAARRRARLARLQQKNKLTSYFNKAENTNMDADQTMI